MLSNLSFRRKIGLLVISALIGLSLIIAVSLAQTRSKIIEGKSSALRTAVQTQYQIVAGFQALAEGGKMSKDDAQKAAIAAVKMARYGGAEGKSDYFYLLATDGTGVMHPSIKGWESREQLTGKGKPGTVDVVKTMMDAAATNTKGAFLASMVARPPKPGAAPLKEGEVAPTVPKLQYMQTLPGWNWIVGSGLYTDDVDDEVMTAVLQQLVMGVVALAAIGLLGWAITRNVLRQLGGEPNVAIAAMNEVADGNLGVDIASAPAGSLLHTLNRMVQSLRTTVIQVRTSTDSIGTASSEIATGNQDLSQRTEQTASNLQQAAASMEQLTSTVKQSADSSRQANQLASSAAAVAARGGEVVSQVVVTMEEINTSSKKIGDIIGVIDSIAFQTNILALNAAVEAARAGEQGRGFAVVASEVRSLAQRSAEAAREIKSLIGASVEKVDSGTRLVADAGATMQEIVSSVQRVSDIIGEITAAAGEQSDGIAHVNTSVTELDRMTQQNAALVEQSAAAAESLKDQADKLSDVVATFRLGTARA